MIEVLAASGFESTSGGKFAKKERPASPRAKTNHNAWKSRMLNAHINLSEWESENIPVTSDLSVSDCFQPLIDWLTKVKSNPVKYSSSRNQNGSLGQSPNLDNNASELGNYMDAALDRLKVRQ